MEWRGNITYQKDKEREKEMLVKFLEILINIDQREHIVKDEEEGSKDV